MIADERGSGSVLALAIVGVIASIAVLVVPLYMGLSARASVSGAADASALAAADVAAGISPGDPCVIAGAVAAANKSKLDGCEVDGLVITVVTSATFLGLPLRASATAGPPDAGTK